MSRLRRFHRQGIELAECWAAAARDLEVAESRLARLVATRDRQVARLLDGMTPRQRAAIERDPSLSWRNSNRRWREAARRRQIWAHRKRKVWALEAAWEPRLAAAREKVAEAKAARAKAAREAARFGLDPSPYTGLSRRRLARLGARPPLSHT